MATPRDVVRAVRSLPLASLARTAGRTPLVAQAEALLQDLPAMELVDLAGPVSFTATLSPADTRHAWSLHATDQLVLQAVITGRGTRDAFEIGTFNGGTTRVLAEALPEDGRVVTLDLPPADFDATQDPDDFGGTDVGREYRSSPAAGKITQLLDDSATFDPAPWAGQFDLVLVDGAHDEEHGLTDTATALALLRPGGIILFDDFQPYWHGLIRGITTAMRGRNLARLAGTSLGVHVSAR